MGANDFAKLPHIGESMKRKEDERFLTGNGQYTDDISLPGQTHAFFLRSPYAHAKITAIDEEKQKISLSIRALLNDEPAEDEE